MQKRLLFPLATFCATTLVMALQKPVFLLYYASEAARYGFGDWCRVVWHGLSLDMTVAGYVTALPLLLTLLSLWVTLSDRTWRRIFGLYFWVVALVAGAVFAVDLALYEHWGFRLDGTALMYLDAPKEVLANVDWWMGIRQTLFFAACTALLVWLYRLLVRRLFLPAGRIPLRGVWSLVLLLLGGFDFLAIRGGVGASVANVSKVAFSPEMFLNQAAVNPLFSFLSTLGDDGSYADAYPFFPEEERATRFEELRGNRRAEGAPAAAGYASASAPASAEDAAPTGAPTAAPAASSGSVPADAADAVLRTQRPNVVVVLLESFGRTVMDATCEGEPVMPNMQRLKSEGVWFENFFANSFRTDRGEVAVLSGFPAQTLLSVMKLPAKAATLPSIARSLGEEGYATSFTYGGDLNFTNQASYLYATGWQELVWQRDLHFDAPASHWGYDDAVMCDYFARRVIELDAGGHPFLAGLLTLSSHIPFDVPYARFDDKVLNAMAFSDECVGRMVERLKASPAWENLLLVLVADHGYPYPEGIAYNIPLRHRIPMLWLGGAVARPRTVEDYGSQMDFAATLLGSMGLSHEAFDYSKDLFDTVNQPRRFAYYTFNEGFGVVDASGEAVWDCAADRAVSVTSPELLDVGRTLLQTTYVDIDRR